MSLIRHHACYSEEILEYKKLELLELKKSILEIRQKIDSSITKALIGNNKDVNIFIAAVTCEKYFDILEDIYLLEKYINEHQNNLQNQPNFD